VIYYKFENLNIPHLFTTKHGGVSTGIAAQMNLDTTKEPRENVTQNYHILCNELGVDFDSLTATMQRHTNNVVKIDYENRGNVVRFPDTFGAVDAMVTNVLGVTLVTLHADCLPLYFYDSVTRSIGLAHAGWRGITNNIAGQTIAAMVREYGATPANIWAGIGPGIRQCCFEVDADVKELFDDEHVIECGEKYKIDLPAANAKLMIKAGIEPKHIEISSPNTCTKCNHSFHSHRRSGKQRGSMAALLAL